MATTPHSSWNLSDIRLQCLLVRGLQCLRFPSTQRDGPLPDLYLSLNCNAHDRGFDSIFFGDGGDFIRVSRTEQHTRRRFVEGQDFRAEVGGEIYLRADSGGAELHSANATARPPSLRSCADSARPAT